MSFSATTPLVGFAGMPVSPHQISLKNEKQSLIRSHNFFRFFLDESVSFWSIVISTGPRSRGKEEDTMARTCSICLRSDLSRVNELLAEGVSVVAIAAEYDIPARTLYRHRAAHTDSSDGELEVLALTRIASRVEEVANDLRLTRLRAQVTGAHNTAIRAAAAELRALDQLSARFGIDDTSIVDYLREVGLFLEVVAREAMTNPQLLAALENHEVSQDVAALVRRAMDTGRTVSAA